VKRLLLACLALAACKTAEPQKPSAQKGADPALYYPLAVGNSWTYEYTPGGRRETIEIVGRDGPWFLDDHRARLRADADGIRDADRYLLRAPLVPGAAWTAVENLVVQHFEVVAVDLTVQTKDGSFTNCIQIRNEQPLKDQGKFVTEWTYAPGVGLALLRTQTVSKHGAQEQSRLELVAHKVH
jgi:hypothetical protein